MRIAPISSLELMQSVLFRWPWLLHHIAKEYRDSAEDRDSDILAFNIVQVRGTLLAPKNFIRLSALTLRYKARPELKRLPLCQSNVVPWAHAQDALCCKWYSADLLCPQPLRAEGTQLQC